MNPGSWKRKASLALGIVLLVGVAVLLEPMAQSNAGEGEDMISLPDWANIELVDAVSGETFRIADAAGKPILVESFAVWCPICLRQQTEIERLLEMVGDSVAVVSIDTDPNESLAKVREHAQSHEFAWLYAISPYELTQQLVDAFGYTVISAPSAPVILIDADGSARLLPNGVKTAEELLEEIGELPEPEPAQAEGAA